MKLFSTTSALLAPAILLAMAPAAMATPQPQEGLVAVGPVGSGPHDRNWISIHGAMAVCRKFGNRCWITDGVQVGPNQWVPNTFVTGRPVTDSAGNKLFEVTVTR